MKKTIIFTIVLLIFFITFCSKDSTSPPTDLSVTLIENHKIQIQWADNSTNEEKFIISRKKGNFNWQNNYTQVAANITSFTDIIPTNSDIVYAYKIRTYDGENYSDFSDTIAWFSENSAPADLDIEQIAQDSLELTWQDNSIGEDGFIIERRVNEGQWSELNSVSSNITAYIDDTVNDEVKFYYRVFAYSGINNSSYSNEICFLHAPEGFVFVQGGTFYMGDHYDEGGGNELPVHSVTLDDFYIGETEVTHQQVIDVFNWAYSQGYINCSSSSVTNNQGDSQELLDLDDGDCAIDWNGSSLEFVGSYVASSSDCPCIYITWYGSVAYCNYKSLQEGYDPCYALSDWSCDWAANGYRLPTEAEWEYAARGGINWTDDYRYSGCHDHSDLFFYAWDQSSAGWGGEDETNPVKTKLPNQLAIYDMSGNVWEWCNDWYDSNYYSSSPPNNPTGPNSGSYRVGRGGGWGGSAGFCRVANRFGSYPDGSYVILGFRILRANLD